MKTGRIQNLLAGALLGVLAFTNAIAAGFTPKELQQRMIERRAVDAVIWGLPLVGEDAVKQAAFRDGKASYNDIVWWPKGGSWKNQSPTPNVNTRYMYFFINTKQDGPVVVELPPAVTGASFYGTIEDAWYVPLVDIGFEGKGGKYLVLPPDYKGEVPDGYTVVRPKTYNTMTLLRSILASMSEKDVQAGNALVTQVRIYPLSKAANPPAQRLLDMTDVMYNGLVKYDETFFTSLARVLNEETVQPRDLQMMGMLLPLGIEKGKEFKPDAATVGPVESGGRGSACVVDVQGRDGRHSVVAGKSVGRPHPAHYHADRIQVGDAELFWRGCASHRPLAVFLPRRQSSAPAVSTSGPFTTTAATRWKAGTTTACTFRRRCQCASSGPSPFTA